MSRIRQEFAIDNGWSRWIRPAPGYRMICCDCGLSHNLDLAIGDGGELLFRVALNNRSTAQVRRHKRKVQ